ncbi:MAG TPA: glucose 1-dehydrogenase [Polyangiales bacterium]|nr:glucose 1-dehydrogenase [Polyangiales bacterium]
MTSRVSIVTGGGRGIGRGIANRLRADGSQVVVFERDAEAIADLQRSGDTFTALRVDVSSESDVIAAMREVTERFGRLDVLVNNAGIADPHVPDLEQLSLEHWLRILNTNLTGMFLCTKHALPLLRRAKQAAIVNVASTRALQSEPHTEAYAASKGGIVALTHALALSLGPTVRVNVVSPGWIDTSGTPESLRPIDHQQHPVGRVGTPEDVAALVAYLAGDEAGFVTGQNFVIDGGMTRKMIYAE